MVAQPFADFTWRHARKIAAERGLDDASETAVAVVLAIEFAAFLGLPVSSRDSQHLLARAVTDVLRRVGCSLVLVDEVHRLDLRTRLGAQASDQLKYFCDSVSATFVYAGLDLEENGMFSGMRGRQIAGRFISLGTSGFGHATVTQLGDWARLVATMEHRHCCCTATSPVPWLRWRPTCTSGPAR